MQALKVLVVLMGVLIIAGVAVIVVTLINRMNDPEQAVEATFTAAPGGTVGLDLPTGARIGEVVAVGNRVVFRVTLPDGPGRAAEDRLYVLDPRDGALVGAVTTGAAPAGAAAR